MDAKLTKKQKQLIEYISDFIKENNYSPTYREIMNGLGLSSVSAVAEHIDNLIDKGYLKKSTGVARSLEVVDVSHSETVQLFNAAITASNSEEDIKTLLKAASLLGLDLEDQ